MGEAFWIILVFILVIVAALIAGISEPRRPEKKGGENDEETVVDCRRCFWLKRAFCLVACPAVNDILVAMEDEHADLH